MSSSRRYATAVLIFARGRIMHELDGDAITKDRLAETCLRWTSAAAAIESVTP